MQGDELLQQWFSGHDGEVVLLKVNRRPLAQTDLFSRPIEDVFDHFSHVLLLGEPVQTGTAHRRTWLVGNRRIDTDRRLLSGRVGWKKVEPIAETLFDEKAKSWVDTVGGSESSATSAFVFDPDNRVLAIALHPSFRVTTLATVFRRLLNQGERETLDGATTDWDVEPLLDGREFKQWLASVDAVQVLRFNAKLPNPDALDSFEPVIGRMKRAEAKTMREIIEARDPERGLQHLADDEVFRAYVAMGEAGFGYVTARGTQNVRPTTYDQRDRTTRVAIAFPDTWPELIAVIIEFLLRRRSA
jgi:hypothetical protein